VFGRGTEVNDRFKPFQSLAGTALFAWLLGVIGVYDIGWTVHLLLAATMVLVVAAAFREDGQGAVDVALIALFAWLPGAIGIYDIGPGYHLLLAIAAVMIVSAVLTIRHTRS
jgi:hypothetical protein